MSLSLFSHSALGRGVRIEEDADKHRQGSRDDRRDISQPVPGRTTIELANLSEIQCYRLSNVSYAGPRERSNPYVAIHILDPIITIERHHGKYHIAARFNMEATILNYEDQARDGNEAFFHDICLQYMSRSKDIELSMKPESDPSAALTVVRHTEIAGSGSTAMIFSHTPSANVSLGLTSAGLTVENALTTWSLSAHPVGDPDRDTSTAARDTSTAARDTSKAAVKPRYQWFWVGTNERSKRLAPDLKYTVKRHVVAERVIPIQRFPEFKGKVQETQTDPIQEPIQEPIQAPIQAPTSVLPAATRPPPLDTLDGLLDFRFRVKIRVKQRYVRWQRLLRLSSNRVKGRLLNPPYEQDFSIHTKPSLKGIPSADTHDISRLLGEIKQMYEGRYNDIVDVDFFKESKTCIVEQEQEAVAAAGSTQTSAVEASAS